MSCFTYVVPFNLHSDSNPSLRGLLFPVCRRKGTSQVLCLRLTKIVESYYFKSGGLGPYSMSHTAPYRPDHKIWGTNGRKWASPGRKAEVDGANPSQMGLRMSPNNSKMFLDLSAGVG